MWTHLFPQESENYAASNTLEKMLLEIIVKENIYRSDIFS